MAQFDTNDNSPFEDGSQFDCLIEDAFEVPAEASETDLIPLEQSLEQRLFPEAEETGLIHLPYNFALLLTILYSPEPAPKRRKYHPRKSALADLPPRSLLDPPTDLAEVRQKIFEGKQEVTFAPHEFEKYWPYFNNIYTATGNEYTRKKDGVKSQHYRCNFSETKKKPNTKLALKDRVRNTPSRTPGQCPKTAQ